MKTGETAREQLRAIWRRLSGLSDKDQIGILKSELLSAFDRVDAYARRVHVLEDQLRLDAMFESWPRSLSTLEKCVLAAAHPAEADDEARRRQQLEEVRLELLEIDLQRQSVEAFCQLLLRRMARDNASGPGAAADTQPSSELTP